MKNVSLRELLEAGCHFGHHVEKWNPKARDFIYGEKNGVHIINLEKTKEGLEKAGEFLKKISAGGGNVIFVATKKQVKTAIKELALTYGLMFFADRWPGGFLTNFDIVSRNFDKMKELEDLIATATTDKSRTKKEILLATRLLAKLNGLYGSVRTLKSLPDVVVIVDVKKEQKVVAEALKTGVKIVGLVDTNADPTPIDVIIPTNDDALGALKLILEYLGSAVDEGRKMREKVDTSVVKS